MRARPLSRLLEASDVILGGLAIARILRLLAGIDHSGCPAWVERRTGRRGRVARRGGGGCASAALSGAALGVGRIVRIGGQSRPAQGQKQTCADREGGGDVCHGYHPSQSRASVLASRERTSRRRFGASRPRFRQARQCSARSGSASRDRPSVRSSSFRPVQAGAAATLLRRRHCRKKVTPLPRELFELASEIFSSRLAVTRWTAPLVWHRANLPSWAPPISDRSRGRQCHIQCCPRYWVGERNNG